MCGVVYDQYMCAVYRIRCVREQESSLWDIKTHLGTVCESSEVIDLMQDNG